MDSGLSIDSQHPKPPNASLLALSLSFQEASFSVSFLLPITALMSGLLKLMGFNLYIWIFCIKSPEKWNAGIICVGSSILNSLVAGSCYSYHLKPLVKASIH